MPEPQPNDAQPIDAGPRVAVVAPSRLHFGLMAFGDAPRHRFAGVGAMIRQPQTQVEVETATELICEGPAADRVRQYARHWAAAHGFGDDIGCRICIRQLPDLHTGLGVGTQLGMATAAALTAHFGLPPQSAEELAASVGRGLRSSIGTHGFVHGGLIVDGGKRDGDSVGALESRVALPDDWRFVLMRTNDGVGLAGPAERAAFRDLSPIPPEVTQRLRRLALDQLVPAAETADLTRFSTAIYEYGHLAGQCFALIQGGPYNGPAVTRVVELARRHTPGVGQSSWGPTVFALLPDETAASEFANQIRCETTDIAIEITVPANDGGVTETH